MLARLLLAALAASAAAFAGVAPAVAQVPDPDGYCVPQNTQYDPRDLARPDAPPIELPPGATMRRIALAGFTTTAIEAGPADSSEAVVFMHGNPGSSLDFLGLLRAVRPGTRLIAFDLLGFGRADKPYDFPFTLEASRVLVDRAVAELGLERVHLVAHDVGSVIGVDWAARHPDRLASAVLLAGGILIGYQDHHFARIWKTPKLGEQSMRDVDREGFVTAVQAHNPRPLPREFVDRNYDVYDRATRCSILRLYRAAPDLSALGREHAAALRPYDRPALVVWGDRDPFLPPYLAESNREGFPSADVHVFRNSGHWPFVDEEERTVELMSAFLRRHVAEQAGARIGLTVSPRRIRTGRRTRLVVSAVVGEQGHPLAGASIRVRGRTVRTGRDGRAALVVRPRRRGSLVVRAAKPPLVPAASRVAVVGRRR